MRAKPKRPLYLDYNATTPIDRRVFESMIPWFLEEPGNAGSRTHEFGRRAKEAVEKARNQVSACIDTAPENIIFTSGATESNNIAILGLRRFAEEVGRKHIVSTTIEHKAVLEPLAQLATEGFEVELAPVTHGGYVEPDEIKKRLRSDTLLVSVMHANNETGVLQPVIEIGQILAQSKILFHVDAAQSFGKEVEELRSLRCDLLSISAHKIYGPKGIGALFLRKRASRGPKISPLFFGGSQERNIRSGTVPVPLVVGFGEAAAISTLEHQSRRAHSTTIKRQLLDDLAQVEYSINGSLDRCQAHVLNISFLGVDSEALMMAVSDALAISNGSACTSENYTPSHVLKAMGLSDELIEAAVRISWGPGIDELPAVAITRAVASLRTVTFS